jgi:hypothetical protein
LQTHFLGTTPGVVALIYFNIFIILVIMKDIEPGMRLKNLRRSKNLLQKNAAGLTGIGTALYRGMNRGTSLAGALR